MSAERKLFHLRIFHKILLTLLLVAFIPIAGALYIAVYQIERSWHDNVSRQLMLTSQGLADRIDGWLDMNLRVLSQNAALPDIRAMDTERQRAPLKALDDAYEWVYLAFTVDPEGRNIGRNDDNPLTYYGDRGYFRQVIEGAPVGQQVLIGRTSGRPALILAKPILDDGGEGPSNLVGVMATAQHLVDVSDATTRARIGDTGFTMVLDPARQLIAHGQPEQVEGQLQDYGWHPILATPGADQYPVIIEHQGQRLVGFRQEIGLGWTVMIQQDYQEAFAPLLKARRDAMTMSAITLVLVVLIAFLLARQISRPIVQLTRAAEGLSRGQFDHGIAGTHRGDEIGALARAIERMSVSIRIALERLRKPA
ncbi:cache domain-containing protein [Ectothiorhodospira lacustris]|uniref:cache domain-containing protein n=1 Tax=Ectothiorhodospira lacustris TaxID=2899127 RepID=UPI001EE81C3F|nr:cache and HAMP domain-containing protein [Ectothiorhodospira lacustris]MCG5501698.1 HAMP domain-containing protein [Ectothiorhodospira lacustris]MCG5510248.1 HAMP domain-containing protein [Ectothiorhodospira lacustris]MCG5521885.1 HAMP domain-containing protein [Ectothiorhodospira lacustris]